MQASKRAKARKKRASNNLQRKQIVERGKAKKLLKPRQILLNNRPFIENNE